MPLKSDHTLLVFQFGGKLGALPLESIEKIAPMAELARPPGLPAPLEGILNLGGTAVPVIRLDRLLHLPEQRLSLSSILLLLKSVPDRQVALLVDRVSEILPVQNEQMLAVRNEDSFNACVVATVNCRGRVAHVLSAARILLEKERESLAVFQAMESLRLEDWNSGVQ